MRKSTKYYNIKIFDKLPGTLRGESLKESFVIFLRNVKDYVSFMHRILKKYNLPSDELDAFIDDEFSLEVLNDPDTRHEFVSRFLEIHIEQAAEFQEKINHLLDL